MEYVTKELIPVTEFYMAMCCAERGIIPESSSHYYALIFLQAGTITITNAQNSTTTFAAPCEIAVVPGHTITSATFPDTGCSTVVFKPESLNSTFQTLPDTFVFSFLRSISTPGYAALIPDSMSTLKIQQLYHNLDFHLNKEQGEFWPCYARSYLLELLMMTDRLRFQEKKMSQQTVPTDNTKASEIFQYLSISYATAITVDQLAKQFATNRTSLNNLFKKICGMSVIEYLTNLRISIASDLLKDTGLTIKEIAIRTGFSEETYFFRTFKKKTGLTPSEFRRQQPNPYGNKWEPRHFASSVS